MEHPLYDRWRSMKKRCLNPNDHGFKYYGARGITVCERWMSFESFLEDMLPTWEEGLQLDRIDNNGNYEPSNCRWVSRSMNSKNRRNRAEKQSSIEYVKYETRTGHWIFSVQFSTQEEAEAFAVQAKTLL